jgi:hypothetical protein
MKKINCILIEPTDTTSQTETAIIDADVVLRDGDVIKNRHGRITCDNPPNEKSSRTPDL